MIPFLVDISSMLELPATGLKISSFPIFALKSSAVIFVSRAGIVYYF
jgi:hypothetical protein